jgi:DHA1 family bicyclomycin/chloramphenicol resistance-like MFS transporter
VSGRSVPLRLLVVLAMLHAVGPISIDMYLPTFPALARDLSTGTPNVQLTLTTFMVGMALGQLVLGPVSDRLGRRRVLIAGTVSSVLAAVVCALAPTVEILTVARGWQGFSGAAGVVVGRAVISDLTTGRAAAQAFSTLAVIQGFAPVAAPLAGGLLAGPVGWRGVFWVTAAAAAVVALAVLGAVGETLPPARRAVAGGAAVLAPLAAVLRRRTFVGYALAGAAAFAALFGYVAASPFVLQDVVGLSTGWYSVVFTVNALGLALGGAVSRRLLHRRPARSVLVLGVTLHTGVSAALVLLVTLSPATTGPVLGLLWLEVFGCGLCLGNATSLALDEVRATAGSGSAVAGALQFALGAAAAPLVGLAGGRTALPMVLVLAGCAALAVVATAWISAPGTGRQRSTRVTSKA